MYSHPNTSIPIMFCRRPGLFFSSVQKGRRCSQNGETLAVGHLSAGKQLVSFASHIRHNRFLSESSKSLLLSNITSYWTVKWPVVYGNGVRGCPESMEHVLVGLARRETVVERHARIGRRRAGLYHASTTEVLVRRCLTRLPLVPGVLVGVFARFAHWVHVVLRKTLAQMMPVS